MLFTTVQVSGIEQGELCHLQIHCHKIGVRPATKSAAIRWAISDTLIRIARETQTSAAHEERATAETDKLKAAAEAARARADAIRDKEEAKERKAAAKEEREEREQARIVAEAEQKYQQMMKQQEAEESFLRPTPTQKMAIDALRKERGFADEERWLILPEGSKRSLVTEALDGMKKGGEL